MGGSSQNGQGDATRLSWRDGALAFVVAAAGAVFFGLALRHHWLSGLQANFGAHAFFFAIPLAWWAASRRFPVGGLEHRQLRPWYLLWALAVVGQIAAAFASPPATVHLPPISALVAQLLVLGLLVGPSEEFLFRGLIQSAINASVKASISLGSWRLRAGTALAAILFGAWHLVNLPFQSVASTTVQVVTATIVGWMIGLLYDRTRNLIGASVLHSLLDFLGAAAPLFAYFIIHWS